MTKRKEKEVLAQLAMPIDGGDPAVCIKSLAKIADIMMETLEKDRMQGALCLAAAAAFLVDAECARWAKEKGEQQSGGATMDTYMHNTMAGWNAFLVMFKDVDPKLPGMSVVGYEDDEEDDETRPKGETLQ
jgi:hypothetical protein